MRALVDKLYFVNMKKIVLETSNVCNVRCVWCWMYFSNKKDMGLLSMDDFRKFIDINAIFFKRNKIIVVPFHRGEPLIHPQFFEMLEYGTEMGIKFSGINTNLSMKIDIKRLMESCLPSILVNVGGTTQEVHQQVMHGSDLELVKRNLIAMFKLNKGNKRISIKMNPAKLNLHQISELPRFFSDLGGDPNNAIIGKTGFTLPEEASKEEKEKFFKNVVTSGMDSYLRFTYDDKMNVFTKYHSCRFLIPTVKWDGKVTICCHDQLSRLNLGNAFKVPLRNILMSKEYRVTRRMGIKRELAFCKNCN